MSVILGFSFHVLTGVFGFDTPHKEYWRNEGVMNRSEIAKSFNENGERREEMKDIIDSFLNRMKRRKMRVEQPICEKKEALKRYRTVY